MSICLCISLDYIIVSKKLYTLLVSLVLFLLPSSSSVYLVIHFPWWTNSIVSLPISIPLPIYVSHLYCTAVLFYLH
jgi:hypothetical protein